MENPSCRREAGKVNTVKAIVGHVKNSECRVIAKVLCMERTEWLLNGYFQGLFYINDSDLITTLISILFTVIFKYFNTFHPHTVLRFSKQIVDNFLISIVSHLVAYKIHERSFHFLVDHLQTDQPLVKVHRCSKRRSWEVSTMGRRWLEREREWKRRKRRRPTPLRPRGEGRGCRQPRCQYAAGHPTFRCCKVTLASTGTPIVRRGAFSISDLRPME